MQDRIDRQDTLAVWTIWTAGIFVPAINDVLNVL